MIVIINHLTKLRRYFLAVDWSLERLSLMISVIITASSSPLGIRAPQQGFTAQIKFHYSRKWKATKINQMISSFLLFLGFEIIWRIIYTIKNVKENSSFLWTPNSSSNFSQLLWIVLVIMIKWKQYEKKWIERWIISNEQKDIHIRNSLLSI